MAIDLATGSGGQRTSRSGRSNAANLDTGQARVRSGTSQREVRVTGSGAIEGKAAVANAVSAFFPALQEAARLDEEQEVRDIKVENADAVIALEAEVMKDREGAREAIRTGDYSKFIPDNEIARRRVIQNSFQSTVAKQMAHEDFDTRVKDIIKQTPLDQNPEDAVDEFLETQTLGASSLFARDYAATIKNRSTKDIAQFRESRLTLQQAQAERQSMELLKSEVLTGAIPLTVEGLDAARLRVIGALPMNAADAVMRGNALFDKQIITMAASGNPWLATHAIKMMEMADPNRDGTSIASRNPGKYQAAVDDTIKSMEATTSAQAHMELEEIEERLSRFQAGQPFEGDSVADMYADLMLSGETHGRGSDYDTLRNQFESAMTQEVMTTANLERASVGLVMNVDDNDWNKIAPLFSDGTAAARMVSEFGLTEAEAAVRVQEQLARRGSGKTMIDINSAKLLGSGDAGEVMEVYARIRALEKPGSIDVDGGHLNKQATAMYYLMKYGETSGQNPTVLRDNFLEVQKQNPNADASKHLEHALIDPGSGKSSGQFGRKGVSEQGRLAWNDLDANELRVRGLQFLGGSKPRYRDLSPNARAKIEDALNQASYMLSGTTGDLEQIRALANNMVANSFGIELSGPDLKETVTLDQTPDSALDPDGHIIPGAKFDSAAAERAQDHLSDPANSAAVTAIVGELGGLRQDPDTAQGHGMQVTTAANGFEQGIRVAPGGVYQFDPDQFEGLPEGNFFFSQRVGDAMVLTAPPAPGPTDPTRIQVTDNVFWRFSRETGQWDMRYADTGSTSTPVTTAELGVAQRASADEQREGLPAHGPLTKKHAATNPFDIAEVMRRQDEILRDRMRAQHKAMVGSPVPSEDHPSPVVPEQVAAAEKQDQSLIDNLQARGILSPQTALADDASKPLTERTMEAFKLERSNGGWLDDMTRPANKQALGAVAEMLEQHEGRVAYVYDDETSSRWHSKKKGDPTIGVGFNMNRPDARKLIGQVGGDFDRLMAGKDTLNPDQIDQLTGLAARETGNWLRNHFKDVDMPNHRWMALMSLAYNSRWNKSGPTLIGPKITAAIKRGDWEAAENEIRYNSSGGVSKKLQNGINLRRQREANLFRGQ